MPLILDSSALFSMEDLPGPDCFAPPGVIKEMQKYGDRRIALWDGLLQVVSPSDASLSRVREKARDSGDIGRLSEVDVSVIALALDTQGKILTDDYSIQNVAALLGVEYMAVGMKAIQKVLKWNYKCLGCGKWYKEKATECPICGAGMRAHRKK